MPKPLDERYLDFFLETRPIFARFPLLEPLRPLIFKQLLVQRRGEGIADHLKRWIRPTWRRAETQLTRRSSPVDALLWIETKREVIQEALMPLYRELIARDVRAELVSFYGPPALSPPARVFTFPARARAPRWAVDAWSALAEHQPGLRDRTLAHSFYHSAAMLQGLYDELHRLCDAVTPRVVVCGATQPIGGAALTIVARDRGIPSVLLQHGIPGADFIPLLADLMVMWGPSSVDIMTPLGLAREQMPASGSPRHDAMRPTGRARARNEFLRAVGCPERPTFVFCSNGHDPDRIGPGGLECVGWLERTARRFANDLNIVIRLHPNEDGSLYRHARHLTVMDRSLNLGLVLEGCDWFGSLCSTVLYDGVLYGRPAWQFYADGWPILVDNWSTGLATRIASEEHLDVMMREMLARGPDHQVNAELVDRIFANHGHATQAVADVVQSCVPSAISSVSPSVTVADV